MQLFRWREQHKEASVRRHVAHDPTCDRAMANRRKKAKAAKAKPKPKPKPKAAPLDRGDKARATVEASGPGQRPGPLYGVLSAARKP